MDFFKNLLNPNNDELLNSSPSLADAESGDSPYQVKVDTTPGGSNGKPESGNTDAADNGTMPDQQLDTKDQQDNKVDTTDQKDNQVDTADQQGKKDIPPYISRWRKAFNATRDAGRSLRDVSMSLLSPTVRNEMIAKYVMESTDIQGRTQAEQFRKIDAKADVDRDGAIADFGDRAKKLAADADRRAKDADPRWKGFTSEYFAHKRQNIGDRIRAREAEWTAVHYAKKVDKYNRKLRPLNTKLNGTDKQQGIKQRLEAEKAKDPYEQSFKKIMRLENKKTKTENKMQPLLEKVKDNKAYAYGCRENALALRGQLLSRRK